MLPVLAILAGALRTGSPLDQSGTWSIDNLRAFGQTVVESGSLRNSAIFAVVATALSVAIGAYFAFIVERTDSVMAKFIPPAMVTSLLVLPLIVAMGYAMLTHDRLGALNRLWSWVTGTHNAVLLSASGWPVLILVSTITGSHASYFLFAGAFSRVNRSLEDASLVSGRPASQTFLRVTLPLLMPVLSGIVLITLVVFLQTFTVPYVLRSNPQLLLTQAVNLITLATPPDYGKASVVGILVLALALILSVLQWLLLRGREFETVTGGPGHHSIISLRRSRIWVNLSAVIFFALSVVVPVISVVIGSFTPYPGIYTSFSLAAYRRVFQDTALTSAAWNSLSYSVIGGFIAVSLALILVLVRVRGTSRLLVGAVTALTVIALGLPAVVQAIGMIWAYATVPVLKELYSTRYLVLIGLVVVVIPLLNQILYGSLRQISVNVEDAAVVAGFSRPVAFIRVTIPLLAPTLISAWFISAVIIFGTLEIPLLLGPPGQSTLIQLIQSSFSSQDRAYSSALTTLFLLAASGLGVIGLGGRALLRRRTAATQPDHQETPVSTREIVLT
ncbi:MAG: ABC transporter permease subunit [Gordonia sp. (in: high G+C Gram-positive bacteria)]